MATIKIERACGCVKNSDLEMETQCENVDEALKKANEMVMTMNEDFCHKHRFKTSYEDGVVLIKMDMNG